MASNNPTFDLGFLYDFEDLENVSETVAETSEASKDQQSESATNENNLFANKFYPSGIWKKILEDNQTRPRKTLTDVFLRSRVSFKFK